MPPFFLSPFWSVQKSRISCAEVIQRILLHFLMAFFTLNDGAHSSQHLEHRR
jgi:hypothetical protein